MAATQAPSSGVLMRYFEAPDVYTPNGGLHGVETTVFLAGGITDCLDWQADMVELLWNTDLVLFNPRRANFPIHDPNAAEAQIKWEHDHLRKADRILFWFPHSPPSVCPITLFELGFWLGQDKRIAVGVEPGYVRESDVRIQTRLARPFVPIVNNLEDLAEAIR